MKKYIVPTLIALAVAAPMASAYVVRNWIDYAQIGQILNNTRTVGVDVFKFQDASSTCYVLIGEQTLQQSLSCVQ